MNNPLIEYTNILHRVGDAEHPDAKQFKESHATDPTFVAMAATIEMAFAARQFGMQAAARAQAPEPARPVPPSSVGPAKVRAGASG